MSVPSKPPWTYRWRTGVSRHSSTSTNAGPKYGSSMAVPLVSAAGVVGRVVGPVGALVSAAPTYWPTAATAGFRTIARWSAGTSTTATVPVTNRDQPRSGSPPRRLAADLRPDGRRAAVLRRCGR